MVIHKWQPIDNIPDRLYLEGLYDDYEGFRLLLRSENSQEGIIRIRFDAHLAYRNTDESERLQTLNNHIQLCGHWPLFIVEESDFTEWLIVESYVIRNATDIVHYMIVTPNDIVDVLSVEAPVVEWL